MWKSHHTILQKSLFSPLASKSLVQVLVVYLDFSQQLAVCHSIMWRLKFRRCNLMLKENIHTLALLTVLSKPSKQEDPSNFTPDSLSIVSGLLLMSWYHSLYNDSCTFAIFFSSLLLLLLLLLIIYFRVFSQVYILLIYQMTWIFLNQLQKLEKSYGL